MMQCDRTARCGVVPAIQELPRPRRLPYPPDTTVTIITPEDDEDGEEERDEWPREDQFPPRRRIPRIPSVH